MAPCSKVIYGFTTERLAPVGTIKLPVTVRDAPRHAMEMTELLVVDCVSAYNVVIGKPVLMALHGAMPIWHLTMKLSTSAWKGCI